jgi:tetratricopeptide (TPR) repeat protein
MRITLLIAAAMTVSVAQAQLPGWSGPYGSILDNHATAEQGGRALRHLYDMRPEAAQSAIDSLKAAYPGHPIGHFLDGLVVWWDILPELSVADTRHDNAFFDAMGRTVKAADRLKKKKQYPLDAVFFKAAALGFRGRHLSNRQEWLAAAKDGKASLNLVFDLAERDPENPDFLFGLGVYNFFASAIPKEYPIVKPFMYFFPDADPAQGIATLHKVAREASFVGTEAAYFLLQIYMAFEADFDKASEMVALLRERHPSNAFFHILEGRVQSRWGRYFSAAEVFEEVIAHHEAGEPGYTDGLSQGAWYHLGRSHMSAGHLEEALVAFTELDELASSDERSVYRAMGRLRAGMAWDRTGYRDEAITAYRAVLSLPKVADSHDQAKRYLKKPFGT